ncbi:MAG: hypothetical protein AAB596_01250 [Patescibacteria group bacterium]
MELLLQFKLIKILNKYNRKNKAPTREAFIKYVSQYHRHNFFYRSDSNIEYENRINNTFGDCIAPSLADRKERIKYYAAYDEDKESLLVTAEGRKFTTWLGFIEMFLKHHSRTKGLIFWLLATLAIINWKPILQLAKDIFISLNRII